jgi:hypothetical protein
MNWTNSNVHHCLLDECLQVQFIFSFSSSEELLYLDLLQHHRALKFSTCYFYLDQHSSEMLKDSFYLHLLHHSSEINPRELNQGTLF